MTDTKSHLLLDEDLDQVDVATGGCCMQWSPQLIVLGVDIGPVVEEELDYVLIVVYAALGRKKCRQIGVSSKLWENEGSYLLSCKIIKGAWTWGPTLSCTAWQGASPAEFSRKLSTSRSKRQSTYTGQTKGSLGFSRAFWCWGRTSRE